MTTGNTRKLPMVDLVGQYREIEAEVQEALTSTIEGSAFINGPAVHSFAESLQNYTGSKKVIPCGNGTDALQIALMALDLKPGDKVAVPAFTYIATVEVIELLGLTPLFLEVDPNTFNLDPESLRSKIDESVKAIITVHLFGQCSQIESILEIADSYSIPVIEDSAQATGATYTFLNGSVHHAGTMSTIGTTSFFPTKNLAAMGDGGALFTNDLELGEKIRMISSHGQKKKYFHEIVGVNSRLDTVQAAILSVKLKYLDDYIDRRQNAAAYYDSRLGIIEGISVPAREPKSTHAFHQYTLKIKGGKRTELQEHLRERGIPSMIYYPLPQHLQNAYLHYGHKPGDFPISEQLCNEVLSIPMHTQLKEGDLDYICSGIESFFS